MTSKSSKSVVLLLLTVQVAIACSTREVPVTVHEGPVVGDEIEVAPAGPSADAQALEKVAPSSLLAEIEVLRSKRSANSVTKASASQTSLATLQTLEPFVLNRNYLENPRITHTPMMRTALQAFSSSLVLLADDDRDQALPWIEKTRLAIESGCDGEMKGCTNIAFFRGGSDSAKIMQISADSLNAKIDSLSKEISEARKASKTNSDKVEELVIQRDGLIRLYYRRLSLSFVLRNQITDPQFEFMYLTRASDYAAAFARSENPSRERALLTRHSEIFELILNHFNPDLSEPGFKSRFEDFVNAFAPWNYSRQTENPFGSAATRMLSLAAKSFLYDEKTGKISKSLAESIRASQEDEKETTASASKKDDASFGDPFSSSFAETTATLKSENPKIWKNLVLSDSMPRDEYFFIIDRIYGGHWTPDDASEIWRGSKRDSTALLRAAEQYIKVQIAGQIVRTNRYMSSIYSNKEWSSVTLFQNAIEKSYPIENQWNQMLSRIERVQLFLDRNLKASNEVFNTEEYKNMNEMLTSVRRNIKYLSVYPNMMLMTYFMAEVKFKIPVRTFFGSYEIDAATIISWFFDGRLSPLFNFGNDGQSLKRVEILYAFLFALKTDTFDAFSTVDSSAKRLDVPRFFEVVVGKYLDADRIALEQSLEDVRKSIRQSNNMTTFLQVCRQDRDLIAKGVKPGQEGATLTLEFHTMTNAVYVGTNVGYGADAWSFHGSRLSEKVKTVNSDLRRKLDFVATMVSLLEKHLETSGTKADEVKATTDKIKGYVSGVKRLQTEYLTEVTRWNKTLSSCLDQALEIEIDRQNDLLELEIQHLRAVWKRMTALRSANNATAVAEANSFVKASLGTSDLGKNLSYEPISNVSMSEYVYAELDVMLRMRQNLKTVAPNVRVLMPSDLMDTNYWKDRRQVVISYNSSEDEFVREGVRNFNGSLSAYAKWINSASDPAPFINRLALFTELYKLGTTEVYDTAAQSCQGKPNITECPLIPYTMTPKMVVDETARVLSLLSLTEDGGKLKRDAEYLRLVGATSRWMVDRLKKFTLDDNGEPVTLFEHIYQALSEDETALDEAREFNLTDRSVGRFLFSPEEDYKVILRRGFHPLVNNHFGRVKALEVAVLEREKSDQKSGKILEYSYEFREGDVLSAKIDHIGGVPVYLSRQKIDDFTTRRILFDRETDNAFKQTEKSPGERR